LSEVFGTSLRIGFEVAKGLVGVQGFEPWTR
jgi:hypothetical protein